MKPTGDYKGIYMKENDCKRICRRLYRRTGHRKNGADIYVDSRAVAPVRNDIFVSLWIEAFFKRGKPLFLQSITMAMGCHSLGSIYHLCLMLTNETVPDGFTPAYLGRIGFFLFFIAASYGQMDRIVDDGTPAIRASRYIACIAPVCAALLWIPNAYIIDLPTSTKVSVLLVWIPALVSVYFNLKHAIIPDRDFGFVKAIKPYNRLAVGLGFAEISCLTAWNYLHIIAIIITSVIFSCLCIAIMIAAKKGAEKWTI